MVGNKAQKAVAAALTGVLAFGGVAPAFAGVWTGDANESWYRVDGSHEVDYQLGTFKTDDEGDIEDENSTKSAVSGTELEKGENRLDTMFDAINYNIEEYEGTNVVVLASGWSQADSLVATGVAGMLHKDKLNKDDAEEIKDVPLILTESGKLSKQAERAIKYLAKARTAEKASDFKVYIVGGTAAVSQEVEDAVAAIKVDQDGEKKAISVERLAGDDRMETSLVAAQEVDDDGWLDDDLATAQNVVFVAGGWAPADALSVSSCAYRAGKPILLTGSDGKLTEDQVAYLQKLDKKVNINVIGGPAAPTKAQLVEQGFTRTSVTETSGATRYETSAAVIEWWNNQDNVDTAIAVASGADAHMADALIGGAFVGANGGVLALVDGVDEVTALREAYAAVDDDVNKPKYVPGGAYVLGGEAAVDKKFADKLNDKFPVIWQD